MAEAAFTIPLDASLDPVATAPLLCAGLIDCATVEVIARGVREAAAEGKAALEAWCEREGVAIYAGGRSAGCHFCNLDRARGRD